MALLSIARLPTGSVGGLQPFYRTSPASPPPPTTIEPVAAVTPTGTPRTPTPAPAPEAPPGYRVDPATGVIWPNRPHTGTPSDFGQQPAPGYAIDPAAGPGEYGVVPIPDSLAPPVESVDAGGNITGGGENTAPEAGEPASDAPAVKPWMWLALAGVLGIVLLRRA